MPQNNNLKVQLFINPAAGRGKGKKLAPKIRDYLQQNGLITKATFSNGSGDRIKQVKQSCLDGCETVIVAGGDGSIYEAVNGIMLAEEILQGQITRPTKTKLGIIPVGTGNDFIKAAKIPKDWKQACELLLNSNSRLVDVAEIVINYGNKSYFVNNIGSGFDAGCGITATKIPFIRGKLVYVVALLWHLLKGVANPVIEVNADNKKVKSKTTLVAVSNGICYGGSFRITPLASINDGLLDAVIAPPVGRLGAIRLIIQLMRGTHLQNPKVTHLQCREFTLKSDVPIPVVVDGEILDHACTGYAVKVLERKINLLC